MSEGTCVYSQRVHRFRWPSGLSLHHLFAVSLTPLAWVILPNLPLLLLRKKLTLAPHGVINLECLLLGICSLFLPRAAVFVLLVLEIAGAFAYELCYSFQFRPADLLTAARSLTAVPMMREVEAALALALTIGTAAAVAYGVPRAKHRLQTAAILFAIATLIAGVDLLDGQNPYAHSDMMTASGRLGMAPWFTLGVKEEFFSTVSRRADKRDMSPMDSASSAMAAQIGHLAGAAKPNVVLIVVESWGLLNDPHLARIITAAYDDQHLRAAYDVSYGTAPFDGLTVPGEARELCHSHIGFGILRVSAAEGQNCLPEQLAAQGYQTTAVHGYNADIFQRRSWYMQLGFDAAWFRPDLAQQGLPQCNGVFPGICDTAIAHWIGSRLAAGGPRQPQFMYWVTLNSHIPVPLNPDLPPSPICGTEPSLSQSGALCSWFRLIQAVHGSVADVAVEADMRPTVFVLVGDHAPPFSQPRLRNQFSQSVVPWVMLTPKSLKVAQKAGRTSHLEASSRESGTHLHTHAALTGASHLLLPQIRP